MAIVSMHFLQNFSKVQCFSDKNMDLFFETKSLFQYLIYVTAMAMIWIIVWVNFSIHHIPIPRHTLESGPGPGSSEKVNPGTLEKAGGSKFTIMVKNSFLINFRVLILNATTAFFQILA